MELKFRAWDKHNKEMEQCHDLYWFEENGVHDSSGEGYNSDYIILPWIGKHDKDGKDVYEGDMVEVERGKHRNFIKERAIVYYANTNTSTGFLLYPIDNWEFTTWDELYVVGNIYENPELCKR